MVTDNRVVPGLWGATNCSQLNQKYHRISDCKPQRSPNIKYDLKLPPLSLQNCLDRFWIKSVLKYILLRVCFKLIGKTKITFKIKAFHVYSEHDRENQWSDNQIELYYGKYEEAAVRTLRQINITDQLTQGRGVCIAFLYLIAHTWTCLKSNWFKNKHCWLFTYSKIKSVPDLGLMSSLHCSASFSTLVPLLLF